MTLTEIQKALAEQHQALDNEGFRPRRDVYTVICRSYNDVPLGGSTRVPKAYCEHPERLRTLVRDHNGQRVICFAPNKEAALQGDLRHAARIPLRELGSVELGHF